MDAGDIHHGLTGESLMFIVSSQTAVASKPAEGAFYDPAPRQDLKPFGIRRTTHHFQFPATMLFDPGDDVFVSTIGPDQFETAPAVVKAMFDPLEQLCDHELATRPIRNTRSMHEHQQEQAQRVYNNMAFASRNLFMDIDTTFFATFGGFDALAINDTSTRLWFSPLLHSHLLHQHSIDLLPQTTVPPLPVVAIRSLPLWQIMRHQSPATATTHNVQDRIHNIAIRPSSSSSTRALPFRQQWRNQRPLSIIQIGWVGLSGHAYKSTRPFSKHSLRAKMAR